LKLKAGTSYEQAVKQVMESAETPCSLIQSTKALFKDCRPDEAYAHFTTHESNLKKKSELKQKLYCQIYDGMFPKDDKPMTKKEFGKKYL